MNEWTIYEIRFGRKGKRHLYNSGRGQRPLRAACGYRLSIQAAEPELEQPLGDRPFLAPDDCKRCCQSLEIGTIGISVLS